MFMSLPNMITMFRIIVSPIICVLISYELKFEASLLFFIACLSDFFDGYIARLYNMSSKFGQHFDSFADKLLITSVLIALIQEGVIRSFLLVPAYLIIVRNLIMYFIRNYFNSEKKYNIPVNALGKITTFFQMISITLIISNYSLIGGFLFWISMILTLISFLFYVLETYDEKKSI